MRTKKKNKKNKKKSVHTSVKPKSTEPVPIIVPVTVTVPVPIEIDEDEDDTTTDIIILLYGDRKDLDRCVASVEKHCSNYKLHIIDNNEVNKGFSKGCNEGILAGNAPYVWLLNQDAVVLEGAQEALINRFSYGEKVGIVGSMQLDHDDHDIIRHGGTQRCFPSGIHVGGRVSMGHCRIPSKQTWVNFASAMLRREMIRQIGVLDEALFLICSDSDYCYMARYRGYEVWYEPRSQVLHRLGVSSKGTTEWHQKDTLAFMDKWGISRTGVKSELFQKLDTYP